MRNVTKSGKKCNIN